MSFIGYIEVYLNNFKKLFYSHFILGEAYFAPNHLEISIQAELNTLLKVFSQIRVQSEGL